MSAEAEPRRSVRATKGQHTKSFDELEAAAAPKRRQTKKSKKASEQESEQDVNEVIRCVCGATEQDEDSGEAWISCETCFVWQHNVCVGVSSFEDEIPENYWCERCRPQDHKELLEGMTKGEKPWEGRRKAHEIEEAERKRRKGGRKPKAKRASEGREEGRKHSATPDVATADLKETKEHTPKQNKRKTPEDPHDTNGKASKTRRVSENESRSKTPDRYTPPADLNQTIASLPERRRNPASLVKRSLVSVYEKIAKMPAHVLPKDEPVEALCERLALQIERAVFEAHPLGLSAKGYGKQISTLHFNLGKNLELLPSILVGTITPPMLAVMTSQELASTEQRKQAAEMRAKAEVQSILIQNDTGPRIRRTHKGDEFVDDDHVVQAEASAPAQSSTPTQANTRRGPGRSSSSKTEGPSDLSVRTPSQDQTGQQQSPSNPDFDISKVFSSVKSPTVGQMRRPSGPPLQTSGPGIDADVDRMLEDGTESPPYSPSEDVQDPDVVWRGSLAMNSIADLRATAKHIGGANFAQKIGPWSELIPKRMTVAGRITEHSATEYLCGLRYSNVTDVVVVSLAPVSEGARTEFNALIDYFIGKKRYGVVGDKAVGNVRDTYLIPVPAGEDNHPEFMLNLSDNLIPKTRTEPMLLAVFVYRHDPEQIAQAQKAASATPSATPVPVPQPGSAASYQRTGSLPGPAFSPATPSMSGPPANGSLQSMTPVPIPQPPHLNKPEAPTGQAPPAQQSVAQKEQAQRAGEIEAAEVLGPHIKAVSVQFLLPQAHQMLRREWEVVRDILERDPRARDDLEYLGRLLESHGPAAQQL